MVRQAHHDGEKPAGDGFLSRMRVSTVVMRWSFGMVHAGCIIGTGLLIASTLWTADSARADTLAAPRDVTAIAADMLAAAGPQNENDRYTIVGTGTEGRTIESSYHRGNDVLITFSRGALTTMRGTHDGAGWRRNVNGITIAAEPNGDSFEPPQRGTLTRVSTPADAYVISDLDAHGYGTKTYVDPTSYHTLHEDTISADVTSVLTYLDYAKFGTQTLAAHWRYEDRATKDVMNYERVQFVAGDTTEAEVAEPPVRSFVRFPTAGPIDLHATFDDTSQRATVPVTIAGKTFTFIINSAVTGIAIDADVTKRVGLIPIDTQQAGTDKRFLRNAVLIPDMDLSSVHLRDIVASTVSFGRNPAAGQLGFDFFAELAPRIRGDSPHRRVVSYRRSISRSKLSNS